jgi:hypothetical protein
VAFTGVQLTGVTIAAIVFLTSGSVLVVHAPSPAPPSGRLTGASV